MGDLIRITGIRAYGFHGVLESEKRDGQEFVVDVEIGLDTRQAAMRDDLSLTADYGIIAQRVAGEVAATRFDLIESLAAHLAAVVLSYHAVDTATITIHKPSAPIPVPFDDVTLTVRRTRADLVAIADAPVDGQRAAREAEASSIDSPIDPVTPAPLGAPSQAREAEASSIDSPIDPVTPAPLGAPSQAREDQALPVRRSVSAPTPVIHTASSYQPSLPVPAVLALGANVGDAAGTLRQAIREISMLPNIAITGVGPLARTAPVGGPVEQPDYFNTVITIVTTHSPANLLMLTSSIEQMFGRERNVQWGPRTLDIDIIAYDDFVIEEPDLSIPHPRAHERAFVLLPWAHLDPTAVLDPQSGQTIEQLAALAPDRFGVKALSLDWFATDTLPTADTVWPVGHEALS
ncbi:2-amino-4-hydroxy-6-hydroxymethyldihydropteridine diphosphokinase [Rarobacter incanus]|uniref:Bifunctional folate synthesis protein n=1 Tax=Rarobacter incanus TaxID=153494 RepID=A0A542SP49_9MICO|nr:2-amino-4-hydroxy-6-hydroxymethyldihydropteridine diphosphokinase [Rarobacter incanus]TQK76362.1 dihydroneopterin aldolase/2-amino-4-hydroxy-6-hydroxymethyldihydropteridine diphosphokinase [Rarobacter incanus]